MPTHKEVVPQIQYSQAHTGSTDQPVFRWVYQGLLSIHLGLILGVEKEVSQGMSISSGPPNIYRLDAQFLDTSRSLETE